jgi:CRP/FNR family transcriptional regulator
MGLPVSTALAEMLRRSGATYSRRSIEHSKTGVTAEPRHETVALHGRYWEAIVRAVETSEFDELMEFAREAGRAQSSQGFDLAGAIGRTIEATNLIELSLLEANDGVMPPIEMLSEIAELRSVIVMAVAEGFKDEQERMLNGTAGPSAQDRLYAVLMRRATPEMYKTLELGAEIPPLYEDTKRFHFVVAGKLRLYNLLPNGRCITLSILSAGDVFPQWGTESQSLSYLCAEAMQQTQIVTITEKDIAELVSAQPAAALEVITNFARRLTESQVLIEDLMNNSVNLRLYRTLLELAKQFGRFEDGLPSSVIDIPLTHQRLADMIGSNRVTVTRKLHELQQRAIIETRRNSTIVLLDPERLAQLAIASAAD